MTVRWPFVDLFSGAGGMSYGFAQHPDFAPLFAVDAQHGKPSARPGSLDCNATYRANLGLTVHGADLSVYSPAQLLADTGLRPGELPVLISCAPCTGFSRALRHSHLRDDARNSLVGRTGLFVEALRPAILVMENARELVQGNFSHHCESLRSHLESLGYQFHAAVHTLSDFGLPQVRERALVLAVRRDLTLRTLPELWSGHKPRPSSLTVRHAIAELPVLQAGETAATDSEHVSPALGPTTLQRLQAIPQDGGSWSDLLTVPGAEQWLIPSMRQRVAAGDFGGHPDVYGRLWWDRPSVTIKRECAHVGNGRYAHPAQDRLCTLRELAILNGFPRNYVFCSGSLANRYRHVGDAVPPLVSHQLAHVCQWMLSGLRPDLDACFLPATSFTAGDLR